MAGDNCIEVTYKCSTPKCNNTQTLRYFPEDRPMPVQCCVRCRAGFGIDLATMMGQGVGMFPVAPPKPSVQ